MLRVKYIPRSKLSQDKLERLRKYRREFQKRQYRLDPEYRNRVKSRAREYHRNNRSTCLEKSKSRYENNKHERLAKSLAYKNDKYRSDIQFRITERLRHRLRMALRWSRVSKLSGSIDLLGCSIADFKIYLESKFEPGMSWENYGYRGWHVDHIIPCALFDLSKPDHQKRCFHFSNMQPMWARENLQKSKKSTDQFRLL